MSNWKYINGILPETVEPDEKGFKNFIFNFFKYVGRCIEDDGGVNWIDVRHFVDYWFN